MFNFSVPATRPAPLTFRKVRALFGVFSVRMVNVFAVRKKFKVVQTIVGTVKVFVVNLKPPRYFAIKRLPNQTVNGTPHVNAIATQTDRKIMLYRLWNQWPVCFIAAPSFAVFNGRRCCDAGVQKRGYINQFGPCAQHFLGFYYLFGSKTFATRNTTYVAKIADFVQSFVPKHGLPLFHGISSLTFRYVMPNHIKGQV